MSNFQFVDRPTSNHRRSPDPFIDKDIEVALFTTYNTPEAAVIPLARFHSSPAKGRLFKEGYKVRHRVRGDVVLAWLE